MTSPSPDRNMDENKERRLRLRKNVLDEIISSEESYIKQLDMLLNVSRNSFQQVAFSFF